MTFESKDSFSWLFSSIFQGLAGFLALAFAGYTLFQQTLETSAEFDESKKEVVEALKAATFQALVRLSVITGIAVLYALAMLWGNYSLESYRPALMAIGVVLAIGALIMGIYFILRLADPRMIAKEARLLLKADEKSAKELVSSTELFPVVVGLERILRKAVETLGLQSSIRSPAGMRQIVERLYEVNAIAVEEYRPLLTVIRYRNLTFHGSENRLPKAVVDMAKKTLEMLEQKLAKPADEKKEV